MSRRAIISSVLVGLGTGIAVPVVELRRLRRSTRPQLPAHLLDGGVGSGSTTRRVTWLGDSLAAGVGASEPDRALPRQVALRLEGRSDLRVVARPGAKVADVVSEQLPMLDGYDSDLIIISVGANDVSHMTRRRGFIRDYHRVLNATAPVPTVVLSIPAIGSAVVIAPPLRWLAGIRGWLLRRRVQRVARHYPHVRCVDIARRPERAAPVRHYLAADGYHPNDHGYHEWAVRVAAHIAHWLPAEPTADPQRT